MNTPTHLLVGAALFAKPAKDSRHKWRNTAILFGALLPDLSIFVLFIWARLFAGYSEQELWEVVYWSEPWQTLNKMGNSFVVFALIGAVALAVRQRWLLALALAALAHLMLDLPVHADDAHIHFWPVTEWRFHSPISYWDPRHFGDVVTVLEVLFGVALTVVLWRRFKGRITRFFLAFALVLYLAVPAYFIFMLG